MQSPGPNDLCPATRPLIDRRDFLRHGSAGFGGLALTALLANQARAQSGYTSPLAPKKPHFTPRAKRVIFLFMEGGPSHIDTFDWKPKLAASKSTGAGKGRMIAPVFPFKPAGQSGLMMADIFPHLARHGDDLCLLNGIATNNPGHQQAIISLHTGNERFVRPSMGAWVLYGLGTMSQELPGFITVNPISNQGGAQNYGSAFLPATFQGTPISSTGGGVPNLSNRHLTPRDQRRQVNFIQQLNTGLRKHDPDNPEFEGAAESLELAFRMQTSVPGVLSINREPAKVLANYGIGRGRSDRFGRQCLLARRLAEQGVRFIQLTHRGWDQHTSLRQRLRDHAADIDQPIAALLADLKARDMLKDTLVIWGGEFGRSPYDDKGDGNGRGHNATGFTMWLAGGGVRGGLRYGATDETGREAVVNKTGMPDLHATILHLLGLDHEDLTYPYAGRDFRLTDVSGTVAKQILS
jgi:hypothetical protein